jgi:hypothetical protein
MIKRVVFFATVVLALMIAIKDGRILDRTGLTGACSIVQTAVDGSQVEACHPGKLEGAPDLRRQGCKDAGAAGPYEYWRCPSSVVAGTNGR